MGTREPLADTTNEHPRPAGAPGGDAATQVPAPPRDAGRTSGGGSLGHVQPDDVTREAPLRNNAEPRESDEPTLPSRDATVNIKI